MTNDIEKIQKIQRTLYNYMKGAFFWRVFEITKYDNKFDEFLQLHLIR